MKIKQLSTLASAMAVVLGLTACGGGGGSSSGSTVGASSVGVITGFGSIFVNGVEFETDSASILIDGEPASEDDLAVGMVVSVNGSDDGTHGNAISVHADDELEGMVLANNIAPGAATGTLNIMGQIIRVDADVIFESEVAGINSVDQIAVDNIVEVNGFGDGTGDVFATRIEVKAADLATYLIEHPKGVEVKGIVSGLDSGAQSFTLGSMDVDYSGAILDLDGGLADGEYVEVRSVAGIDINGTLVASKVELENEGDAGHHGDEDEEFEIKGILSTDFDGNSFVLDGTTVLVNEDTEFEDGDSLTLSAGAMVEVEGYFDADGNLVAEEIELEDEADQEISGVIASIEASDTNTGTITLTDNTVIAITSDTLMKDSRDNGMMPVEMFNLTFLAQGDYIEVRVFTDAAGDLVAVKLEREDNS